MQDLNFAVEIEKTFKPMCFIKLIMNKKQTLILLALILLLGTFLRFYNLGAESFWLDESATALTLKKYNAKEIFQNTYRLGQILPEYYISNLDLPPYYIMLKYWTGLFGLNEASLRAFSALFGTLSILIIYLLAKEMFSRKTALISSLIFSLNVVMVEYSQEARLYSFLTFIVLLSAYFLLKSLKTNQNKHIAGLIISNAVGIYTHYPFIFFVIFEIVFISCIFIWDYLKQRKLTIKKSYFAMFFIAALYLPLLPRILKPKLVAAHFIGSFSPEIFVKLFLQFNTWLYPSQMLRDKINNMQFGLLNLFEWALIMSVIGISIILFIFFLKNFIKIKNLDDKKIFLLLWLVVPSLVAFIALYRSFVTFGSIKLIIFVVPAYLMLASAGMSKIKNRTLSFFLVLFVVLSIFPLYSYYSNLDKPQYKEAVDFLEINSNNEIIIMNLPSVAVPFSFYSEKLTKVYGISDSEEAGEIVSNSDSVWLVLSTKHADKDGKIKGYFEKNYKLIETKLFYDVSVYHYVKR